MTNETSKEVHPMDLAIAAIAADTDHIDSLLNMTSEEFAAKTVKQQSLVLFELVKAQSEEVRAMADNFRALLELVYGYERLAKERLTPEGIQQMLSSFMGMGGLGKLF